MKFSKNFYYEKSGPNQEKRISFITVSIIFLVRCTQVSISLPGYHSARVSIRLFGWQSSMAAIYFDMYDPYSAHNLK